MFIYKTNTSQICVNLRDQREIKIMTGTSFLVH